jgi:ribosomal protein L5
LANISNAADQRYKSGIGGMANIVRVRLEHETQFAQQFSIALDQLRGCKHGNAIDNVLNSFYISDLPALLACMTKANPKTGKLESYSQRIFFILFFGAGFELVKDPRRYRGDSVKKGDVLTGFHPDKTAFLPGNAPSIAKVVVKKHVPQTNDGVELSGGKGALAPDSDMYELPSSCVNRKHLKNFTSEEKENVISHMMTLDEDKLEEFLDNRLTLLVKQRLLGHLGIKTNKNSAECKVLIVDAIKKRNEEELDEKPAAKPDI